MPARRVCAAAILLIQSAVITSQQDYFFLLRHINVWLCGPIFFLTIGLFGSDTASLVIEVRAVMLAFGYTKGMANTPSKPVFPSSTLYSFCCDGCHQQNVHSICIMCGSSSNYFSFADKTPPRSLQFFFSKMVRPKNWWTETSLSNLILLHPYTTNQTNNISLCFYKLLYK